METKSLTLQAGAGAFGDAGHPTTTMLLQAMASVAPDIAPQRICDMGAGSGILSLRAAQLWPDAHIYAAELERTGVDTIRANAEANGMGAQITPLHSDGFRHPGLARAAPFDLILMNILAEPILRLLHEADTMLARGGLLMLSGMMEHQEQTIVEAALGLELELSYRLSQNGWAAHLWQKP